MDNTLSGYLYWCPETINKLYGSKTIKNSKKHKLSLENEIKLLKKENEILKNENQKLKRLKQ